MIEILETSMATGYEPLLECHHCGPTRHRKIREEPAPVLDFMDPCHVGNIYRTPRQHMIRTLAGPVPDEMIVEIVACVSCGRERRFGSR